MSWRSLIVGGMGVLLVATYGVDRLLFISLLSVLGLFVLLMLVNHEEPSTLDIPCDPREDMSAYNPKLL